MGRACQRVSVYCDGEGLSAFTVMGSVYCDGEGLSVCTVMGRACQCVL